MKRIIASRASGKSTELLRMALENHGNIAVFSSHAVETFVVLARDVLHIPPEEIETAYSAGWARIKDVTVASILEYVGITDTRGFNRAKPLYIDEIGLCMQSLLYRFKLGGYTESLEEASYENVDGEKRDYEEET